MKIVVIGGSGLIETSGRNLLAAEDAAGVGRHVALSVEARRYVSSP